MVKVERASILFHCLLGSGVLFLPVTASAAEWSRTATVSAGAVYTDNVNLSDTAKQGELTGTLTPSVSVHGKGGRASLDLTGALEINGQGGNTDSVNPRLQANANAELYERLAFIDLSATATQNAIDSLNVSGIDNLSNNTNRTTTYNYRISPYLKSRFKGIADTELRYTYNELNHSENNLSDTSSDEFSLSIASGPEFADWSWRINASDKSTDNSQGEVSQFSSANLFLGYQVNRQWQINGTVGTESNDFSSVQSSQDGSSWDVGVRWTPSARTQLEIGAGERFFGTTKRLSLTHKSKRSVLTASYTTALTDSTTLLSNQVVFVATDEFGNFIPHPVTGDPYLITLDLPSIGLSTFVDERFALSYSIRGRRTTLTLSADMSDQTYQDSTREVSTMGLGASLSRTLSDKVSGDVSLNWDQQEESGTGNRENDFWRLQAGINRQLGQKTNLRFNYSFTDRSSNQAGQDYQENRLSLTLTHTL